MMAKVTMIFKILHNLTPPYLKKLVPDQGKASYATRHEGDFKLPLIRKNYFLKSFLPSGIRLWNKLEKSIKSITDLESFKRSVKKVFIPNKLYKPYLWGFTPEYINLSRIRMGLSGLNSHRKRYHFITESRCPKCNSKNEDTTHFLLECPAYTAERAEMLAGLMSVLPGKLQQPLTVSRQARINLTNMIVLGTGKEDIDLKIFAYAGKFISETKRFNWP